MDNYNLYKDIRLRTGGEIYIGVVGPVRTGKSTFIKRFMDLEVLPGIEDVHSRERAKDELPQSAAGRTIMTTEPKFIPKEAANIKITDDISVLTRLIDCVGYMVDGAAGHTENNTERMVKTPWFDYEIPFTQAAELGTQKVIRDHSTVGIVVTADGSFGDISRESFVPAEERTIAELKKIGKPFVVILNSGKPHAPETMKLATELEEKYKVSVLPINCVQLRKEDILKILSTLLEEFPVVKIDMAIPKWAEMLPAKHPVKAEFIRFMKNLLGKLNRMRDIEKTDNWLDCAMGSDSLQEYDGMPYTQELKLDKVGMADGSVAFRAELEDKHYYDFLSDMTGVKIDGEYSLVQMIRNMAVMRSEYEKVEEALSNVRRTGYGVVAPAKEEVELSEPEIIKQGNKFGVKINAKAPSIHLIQADIQMEISPIVGSEEQAKDLVGFIKHNSEDPEVGIWNTNIFGKSIEQIVEEGIQSKMNIMTETSRSKLSETIYKVINDGNGGLVCIII